MIDIRTYNHYKYFTDVTQFAKENNCHDLCLGLPDFDVNPILAELLKEAAGKFHSYESLNGNEKLIESLVAFNKKRRNPLHITSENVHIIPCSTFGVYTALQSILEKGDEVVVFEPCYYTYNPIIEMNGAIPKRCLLKDDYSIDFESLKACITDKTKAIIVNSPHNPSGKIVTKEDWKKIYDCIKNYNIYVISEEIYDTYLYEDRPHYSPMHHEQLKERTFSIFSFGKMFHITGWKTSYMLASPQLLSNFREHHQYISYGVNSAAQHALADYLPLYEEDKARLEMQEKRDLVLNYLNDSLFKIIEPAQGAFYQIIDFSEVNTKLLDTAYADYLLKQKGIALLPLSAFYSDKKETKRLRLSFTRNNDSLEQAMEHLLKSI